MALFVEKRHVCVLDNAKMWSKILINAGVQRFNFKTNSLSRFASLFLFVFHFPFLSRVPAGSPSHSRDVAVYVFDKNQPSLSTPLYSVPVSVSVLTALSTVFHCINSPDNSPLSHSVLLVLFLP